MLAKLIGLVFIIIGGIVVVYVFFPFVGALFNVLFYVILLAIVLGFIAIGYRLIKRED